MTDIFCCTQIRPYRPFFLNHEAEFTNFIRWERQISGTAKNISALNPSALLSMLSAYAVQVIRQVNYGPVKWKRYFVANGSEEGGDAYREVIEYDLIEANYEKLNSYKNFKCEHHNLFFKLNIYKKNPINKNHWRANIARPAGDINLDPGSSGTSSTNKLIITQPSEDKKNDVSIKNEEDKKEHKTGGKGEENEVEANKETVGQVEGNVESDLERPTEALSTLKNESISFQGQFEGAVEDLSDGDASDDNFAHYDYYDSDFAHYDYYDSDDHKEEFQDFTACSAEECGYCGKCLYD